MRFREGSLLLLDRGLKLGHCLGQLSSPNQRAAKLVVSSWEDRTPVDRPSKLGDRFVALANVVQHAAQIQMRFGEGRLTGGRGDWGTGRRGDRNGFSLRRIGFGRFTSQYCCRPLAPSPLRPLARARVAFSLSDCCFEFLTSLFQIAALVERTAEIAVSLSVISVTDFKSQLKLA